jgi:hypothetical protein
MAIAVNATKNTLSDAYKALGTWISVHTGDPTTTGGSEASGGSPAYARVATTWGSSSAGVVSGSQVTINVPAGTYTYVGLWDASTAGNYRDKCAITSTTLGAQGQILVTPTFTIT